MGTILARSVVTKAERIIQDLDGVRWPYDEMLGWLNSGQREIVLLRPDASSRTVKFQLLEGTQQNAPATALRMLRVVRNLGSDGNTPGRAIRLCEFEVLDSQIPDWHAPSRANATAIHWLYDEAEPKTFYVYPPQPSSGRGWINAVVSQSPADCTMKDVKNDIGETGTADSVISIDDIFEGPLIDYLRYRALSKETKYAGDGGKADQAYGKFLTALGVKTETDKRFTAKRAAPPHANPNVPGNSGPLGD